MRSQDVRALTGTANAGISATTVFPGMPLIGGLYQLIVVGTWNGGSAQLTQIGPDGVTVVSVSQSFTANGGAELYLPPGVFTLTLGGSPTALWASLTRIPIE